MPNDNNKRRTLRTLHRWLGITALIFLLLLVLTGWMLNHTEFLGLDESYMDNEAILDWYGVSVDTSPVIYPAGDHWITWLDGHLYFDTTLIAENSARLVGAVAHMEYVVAATPRTLYVLLDNGQLVEQLGGVEGVPTNVQKVGIGPKGELAVKSDDRVLTVNIDTVDWRPAEAMAVDWSIQRKPPKAYLERVLEYYRGRGLTVERLVLDLHSGRIGGSAGVLFMDFVALVLGIVGVTGLLMWVRRNNH